MSKVITNKVHETEFHYDYENKPSFQELRELANKAESTLSFVEGLAEGQDAIQRMTDLHWHCIKLLEKVEDLVLLEEEDGCYDLEILYHSGKERRVSFVDKESAEIEMAWYIKNKSVKSVKIYCNGELIKEDDKKFYLAIKYKSGFLDVMGPFTLDEAHIRNNKILKKGGQLFPIRETYFTKNKNGEKVF